MSAHIYGIYNTTHTIYFKINVVGVVVLYICGHRVRYYTHFHIR